MGMAAGLNFNPAASILWLDCFLTPLPVNVRAEETGCAGNGVFSFKSSSPFILDAWN